MPRAIGKTGEKALVIKIGGSLLARAPDLIPVLKASRQPLLIVPGGGIFADAVRQAKVDDEAAHWMAIAAMEQYGWLLSSRGLPVTAHLTIPCCTTVFLPYACLRQNDPLPHTWDVTSDSIAAWVAGALHQDLLLLKSTDGIMGENGLHERIAESMKTDVVDPFFISYVLKNRINSAIINGSDPERVQNFLKGMPVPGTIIGTTF